MLPVRQVRLLSPGVGGLFGFLSLLPTLGIPSTGAAQIAAPTTPCETRLLGRGTAWYLRVRPSRITTSQWRNAL